MKTNNTNNSVEVKHVVMYSGGAGSSWVGKYVADKFGKENTILLHTDTKWEDEDCYRFMDDCAEYIGVPVTYVEDGRTPEDVFRKDLYFGNFGTAPCSKQLKMYQTFEYIQNLIENGIKPILYFGIDYGEVRRAPRIAYNYKHNIDVFDDGIEVRFPLVGEIDGIPVNGEQLLYGTGYLDSEKMPRMYNNMVYGCLEKQNFVKCESIPKEDIQNEWGVKLPRMYDLGFSHANCFSADTKFITDEGIKTFEETVGQKVKVLGIVGDWKDAEIKHFGKQQIVELTVKKNNQTKTISTTAEHRWFKLNEKEYIEVHTDDLEKGDYLESMFDKEVLGDSVNTENWKVVEIKTTDRFEDVYCAVVPDGQAFTLEDNIFTGNCAGKCIKAGRGHYRLLFNVWKDRYLEQEQMEREINDAQLSKSGKRYTILSKMVETGEFDDKGKPKKKKVPFSLEEFRVEILEPELEGSKVDNTDDDNETPCECVF